MKTLSEIKQITLELISSLSVVQLKELITTSNQNLEVEEFSVMTMLEKLESLVSEEDYIQFCETL